ncbi:MAG: FecR family protein [Pirellulales bacterium]
MKDQDEFEGLIDRHLRGELNEAEKARLAERLDSDAAARQEFVEQAHWDTEFAEALRESRDPLPEPSSVTAERSTSLSRWPLAVAAAVVVALVAGVYFLRPSDERPIARIIGLSGTLIWTGDHGQIVRDIEVGTELAGGTIEGMAPDSWLELQFNDSSTVMISGTSMLTFADLGQKELRLREGILSANVVPQPQGKPMLIHTRSALLEVLGTQFDVETSLTSTVLNVSQGKVRLKRLSDGSQVDVPAKHRVTAGDDREMIPQRVPDSVHDWKSHLHLGPDDAYGNYGKWSPTSAAEPASIRAIPFIPRENRSVTLYLLGLAVVRSDGSPVIVKPDSQFIVRGRLTTATDLFFGIRVTHANGEFAGKFIARKPAQQFRNASLFEAVFQLSDFTLDPCVRDRKDELPAKPDDLILTGVWSFTHTGGPAGLAITEVELVAPDGDPNG